MKEKGGFKMITKHCGRKVSTWLEYKKDLLTEFGVINKSFYSTKFIIIIFMSNVKNIILTFFNLYKNASAIQKYSFDFLCVYNCVICGFNGTIKCQCFIIIVVFNSLIVTFLMSST